MLRNSENPYYALNKQVADQINEDALKNPDSPYAGKFVGIVDGQVEIVGDSRRDVVQRLLQLEPDRSRCLCFEAGVDYSRVVEIWSRF